MADDVIPEGPPEDFVALVQKVLSGPIPKGLEFDAARAVLIEQPGAPTSFRALCILLEGALAEPTFSVKDTQTLVPLLKELARGTVEARDLL
ncbi:MAG: hypothetical protein GY906_30760 [bacterium]|nr:hypothetical protein [bacterium]